MDRALTSVTHISVGAMTNWILCRPTPALNLATSVLDVDRWDITKRTVSNLILSIARGSARCPTRTFIMIKASVWHIDQMCEKNVEVLP